MSGGRGKTSGDIDFFRVSEKNLSGEFLLDNVVEASPGGFLREDEQLKQEEGCRRQDLELLILLFLLTLLP